MMMRLANSLLITISERILISSSLWYTRWMKSTISREKSTMTA